MSDGEKKNLLLPRRRLLVLGVAAAIVPACSGPDNPLGGPYGGTANNNLPGPTSGGSSGGSGPGGGSGGGSGSGSGSGSGGGSGSSSGSGGGSGSSSSGSSSGTGSSSGSGSGSGSGSSSGTGSGSGSGSSSGGPPPCGASKLSLLFSQYPQLMTVGGSVSTTAPGYADPNCQSSDIIVICTAAAQYVAFGAECNHECTTPAKLGGTQLYCPRHGATWDLTGKLTQGPATGDLQQLMVCSDAMGVHITY